MLRREKIKQEVIKWVAHATTRSSTKSSPPCHTPGPNTTWGWITQSLLLLGLCCVVRLLRLLAKLLALRLDTWLTDKELFVRDALRESVSGKPGVAQIDVPIDVSNEELGADDMPT